MSIWYLVGIYQSEGIYQKVMILFKVVWICYITSDSHVTVT